MTVLEGGECLSEGDRRNRGLIMSIFETDPPPFFLDIAEETKNVPLWRKQHGRCLSHVERKRPAAKAATTQNRRAHEAEASPTDKSVGSHQLPSRRFAKP